MLAQEGAECRAMRFSPVTAPVFARAAWLANRGATFLDARVTPLVYRTFLEVQSGTRRLMIATLVATWGTVAIVGLLLLTGYSNAPGPTSAPPADWPAESAIRLNRLGDTLIVFAHPRCPCTRASLSELEKIVAHHPRGMELWVLFYKPSGISDWPHTDLWETAAALPAAHVIDDLDGRESQRFQAATSGQALLYNAQGRLLFAGGITPGRGHAGDNAGRSAIETLLAGGQPGYDRTPVFGCPILTIGAPAAGAP